MDRRPAFGEVVLLNWSEARLPIVGVVVMLDMRYGPEPTFHTTCDGHTLPIIAMSGRYRPWSWDFESTGECLPGYLQSPERSLLHRLYRDLCLGRLNTIYDERMALAVVWWWYAEGFRYAAIESRPGRLLAAIDLARDVLANHYSFCRFVLAHAGVAVPGDEDAFSEFADEEA